MHAVRVSFSDAVRHVLYVHDISFLARRVYSPNAQESGVAVLCRRWQAQCPSHPAVCTC
jgi:hypothetical protein